MNTSIAITDGEIVVEVAGVQIMDWRGSESGLTVEEAAESGQLYMVDDDRRGESTCGMHGAIYWSDRPSHEGDRIMRLAKA